MEDTLLIDIRERYQHILDQIASATARSRREEGAVHLVVVTKSQPLDVVQMAITAGATILGENYAEEAEKKIAAFSEVKLEWHMIGHVQSRKADIVARNFTMLHSLDSLKLAERLERFCAAEDRILPVLLEVNVSGEESKFGFQAWDERFWIDLVSAGEQILAYPHLHLRGLMTMPPFFSDPEQTRPYFRRLRQLQEFLIKHLPVADWKELSMGTSVDFIAAIEEGATYVRVGQAILGPRPERKI
jgi:PLP dependent protein